MFHVAFPRECTAIWCFQKIDNNIAKLYQHIPAHLVMGLAKQTIWKIHWCQLTNTYKMTSYSHWMKSNPIKIPRCSRMAWISETLQTTKGPWFVLRISLTHPRSWTILHLRKETWWCATGSARPGARRPCLAGIAWSNNLYRAVGIDMSVHKCRA